MHINSLQFIEASVSSSPAPPQLLLLKVSDSYKTVYISYSLNAVVPNTLYIGLCVLTRCAEGTVGDCVGGRMAQSV